MPTSITGVWSPEISFLAEVMGIKYRWEFDYENKFKIYIYSDDYGKFVFDSQGTYVFDNIYIPQKLYIKVKVPSVNYVADLEYDIKYVSNEKLELLDYLGFEKILNRVESLHSNVLVKEQIPIGSRPELIEYLLSYTNASTSTKIYFDNYQIFNISEEVVLGFGIYEYVNTLKKFNFISYILGETIDFGVGIILSDFYENVHIDLLRANNILCSHIELKLVEINDLHETMKLTRLLNPIEYTAEYQIKCVQYLNEMNFDLYYLYSLKKRLMIEMGILSALKI